MSHPQPRFSQRWRATVGHDASSLTRYCETINEHPGFTTLGISILYFAVTLALSSIKLIWLNEFITLYISKLGNLHSILNALSRGASPQSAADLSAGHWIKEAIRRIAGLALAWHPGSWAGPWPCTLFFGRECRLFTRPPEHCSSWRRCRRLIVQGRPARLLPIFTDLKDIQGFTPLAHGPVWFFAEGSFPDLPVDARVTLSEAAPPEIHEIQK